MFAWFLLNRNMFFRLRYRKSETITQLLIQASAEEVVYAVSCHSLCVVHVSLIVFVNGVSCVKSAFVTLKQHQ